MRIRTIALAAGLALLGACDTPTLPDYNNPTAGGPITSQAQLQSQAVGLLEGDRANHGFEILLFETMARDAYRIDPAEPRYISNPLGTLISASNFIGGGIYNAQYRTIRGAIELINGIDSSSYSAEDKAATKGFAQTIKALEYMRLRETRDTLGAVIQSGTATLQDLDPFSCKGDVLAYISAVLDSGAANLKAAGAAFPFTLPSGFDGFDTPATFLEFNRALKAKNELAIAFRKFAKDSMTIDAAALARAQSALDSSFYSASPSALRVGVYHTYSTAGGETPNPNFDLSVYRVNPKVVAEADAGDRRVAAKVTSCSTRSVQGVSSDLCFANIASPSTPLPIVIDAELVVDQAKIYWAQDNYAPALAESNILRVNEGGLAPRTLADFGTLTGQALKMAVLKEILKQERYSLLFESQAYFVELRALGLFTEDYLGLERPGVDENHPAGFLGQSVFPIPQNEKNARGGTITYATCQNP